jgi:hypothetical protein
VDLYEYVFEAVFVADVVLNFRMGYVDPKVGEAISHSYNRIIYL